MQKDAAYVLSEKGYKELAVNGILPTRGMHSAPITAMQKLHYNFNKIKNDHRRRICYVLRQFTFFQPKMLHEIIKDCEDTTYWASKEDEDYVKQNIDLLIKEAISHGLLHKK
jgi:hypothetical protein